MHAVNLAKPADDETHVIMGAGIIGLGVLQGIKYYSSARTIVVDLSDKRLATLNGDGWSDLVVGDGRLGACVYLNDGQGGMNSGLPLGEKTLVPYAIAVGDMNRDGKADVVIGYVAARGSVFFNDGSGRSFEQVRFGDGQGAVYGLALGDVDGDGYPDIAAARSGAPNILYFSGK